MLVVLLQQCFLKTLNINDMRKILLSAIKDSRKSSYFEEFVGIKKFWNPSVHRRTWISKFFNNAKITKIWQFAGVFIILFSTNAYAAGGQQYPNISGDLLAQTQFDRVLTKKKQGVSPNNGFIYVQPSFSLNFNKNWSIKTEWRLQPNNVLTTRNSTNPERYRNFLVRDRSAVNASEMGLLIEQLKVHFENEDLEFEAGKFDPGFGMAHRKTKRMGIFTAQVTEDYNLREKLGMSLSALLEHSKLTVNTFFNDFTGLSSSAIDNRGKESKNDGIAGNTGTLSSYSITLEGNNILDIEEWHYYLGYRVLDVDNIANRDTEKGYVASSEYIYPLGLNTNLIPFIEYTKIRNFTGEQSRNADYTTLALILEYSSWTASTSYVKRSIDQNQRTSDINDKLMQISLGYKFTNNLSLDFTRSTIKESGAKGSIAGFLLSYSRAF